MATPRNIGRYQVEGHISSGRAVLYRDTDYAVQVFMVAPNDDGDGFAEVLESLHVDGEKLR